MRTIRGRSKDEMSTILDYVHDRRYSIEAIVYDGAERTLRIPVEVKTHEFRSLLGFAYRGKGQGIATLIIKNVSGWKILEDRAQIGYGDINRILTEPGIVLIEGSMPVNIQVQVDAHELELDVPDNVAAA